MKLFNKQRFQSFKGKGLQRYLLYAIGEIILVVVGILIALGINNWKQEQTEQKELERIIALVKADLTTDLVATKNLIDFAKTDQQLTENILHNPKFKDSIRNCEDCRYIMARVYVSNFNSKGYELLSNFNKDIKTRHRQVDSILNFYSNYKREDLEIRNQLILDEIVDHMKYLRDHFDWFSEWFIDGNCYAECLDYFTGKTYMNRLTYYEALFFDDYIYGIKQYRKDLEALLDYLKDESI